VATALLGWVAALAAGLFAGAALYVSLVEHPARLSLGSRAAVHEFGPSYRRGAALQAPLALIGALAAIGRWALGGSVWWLAGGIALGALVPYTLVIVLPTSTRLLDPALDRDSRGSVLLTSAVCSPR
jgi:anthrone oxygenase-like protein